MTQIRNLDHLLNLPERIKFSKIKNLTSPGENYGSLMLSVDIVTEDDKELNIVAKTLPPNPEMQEMFNCPVTFRKEIAFYKTIFPTLRSFQIEKGAKIFNFAAKYYGSRPNLHQRNDAIDDDAALLLENLKIKGFINLERTQGFDLDSAKLVLRDLAQLHGSSIALKLQETEIFEKEILPHLTSLVVPKEVLDDWGEKYLKVINSIANLEPYLERLKKVSVDIYPPPKAREPWGTISHNDCWVNNTMVLLKNGKPIENKLVDFQLSDYGSPARDVLFFIFSSIQSDITRKYCDDLFKYYHENLIVVLKELDCDTEEFSYEEFQKELNFEAKHTQFAHTALMLFPIFAPKLDLEDMADVKPTDIGNAEPTDLHKEKLIFLVEEFAKRQWI